MHQSSPPPFAATMLGDDFVNQPLQQLDRVRELFRAGWPAPALAQILIELVPHEELSELVVLLQVQQKLAPVVEEMHWQEEYGDEEPGSVKRKYEPEGHKLPPAVLAALLEAMGKWDRPIHLSKYAEHKLLKACQTIREYVVEAVAEIPLPDGAWARICQADLVEKEEET